MKNKNYLNLSNDQIARKIRKLARQHWGHEKSKGPMFIGYEPASTINLTNYNLENGDREHLEETLENLERITCPKFQQWLDEQFELEEA